MSDPSTAAQGQRVDDQGLAALLLSGHPVAEVAREHAVAVDLVVAGPTLLRHRAWAAPDRMAVVLAVQPGLHQVMMLPPSHLAVSLVRLTRPGVARRGPRVERVYPARELDRLLSTDPAVRADALELAGASRAWRLEVSSPGRRVEVVAVDGAHGPFLADPGADLLRPVDATSLYRVFSTLLPSADPLPRSPGGSEPRAQGPAWRSTASGEAPRTSSAATHSRAAAADSETGRTRQ
ncbi:hypothetical protein BKA08_002280 [Nocardioides marinisabuli]|uniref:Uncharacterized protein n=1 Tax=Nocardioides marinisabuli TaxID=419476 RepID=A0A7Y9JQF9_9ACTN|nr:hypothetical protein [Nocardioides marinisabuli]NYD58042.1 hypothetical protein [Nocardioides marinisabuli]